MWKLLSHTRICFLADVHEAEAGRAKLGAVMARPKDAGLARQDHHSPPHAFEVPCR